MKKIQNVAIDFAIAPNTLFGIYKRDSIKRQIKSNPATLNRKKITRNSPWYWYEFLENVRQYHLPVSGKLLQLKTKKFAEKLNVSGFKASNGWLQKFKKRKDIKFKCLTGDAADADKTITIDYVTTDLPSLLQDYNECGILNVDESALFYQLVNDKTINALTINA